jgi:hypothetical protein
MVCTKSARVCPPMTYTEPSHEMIELSRALQDLTIQHACPTGTSRSRMVSTTTTVAPSLTLLSPNQLYSQQKDAQQGLQSATPQPKISNTNGAGRNGDTSLFTHPHGICRSFLKTRSCPYGHYCKFIHVANPGYLQGPDDYSLHRSNDLRPFRNFANIDSFRKTVPRVTNLSNARRAWICRHPDIAILVCTKEQTTKIVHHLE